MNSTAIAEPIAEQGRLLDSESLYEVVDGLRVEVPAMGTRENYLASLLVTMLTNHVRPKQLGFAVMENLFNLGPDTPQRRPDVAFVSKNRWPKREVPSVNAWPVVPDLAVEIVSHSNTAWEIAGKVDEYLRAGVIAVWVIYPELKQVYVHESSSSVRVVGMDGHLEGGQFLPGLSIPIASLFEELTADA